MRSSSVLTTGHFILTYIHNDLLSFIYARQSSTTIETVISPLRSIFIGLCVTHMYIYIYIIYYDNDIILPYQLSLFRSASAYVGRIVANIIIVFSHHRLCPASGWTLISRFALNHLSTPLRSRFLSLSLVAAAAAVVIIIVWMYISFFFSSQYYRESPLTPPMIIVHYIPRDLYEHLFDNIRIRALYDFKKQSIKGIAPCHPTARRPTTSIRTYRSRCTLAPLPASTCALCQHFGVFYCGYKRVSPSEPLSNNTGPLCWLKNKSNFPLFRSSRIYIYINKYKYMCTTVYMYIRFVLCTRGGGSRYTRIMYNMKRIV